MINSKDVYNFIILIQSVEYSEFSNAVSPGVRDVIFQFFDILSGYGHTFWNITISMEYTQTAKFFDQDMQIFS